MENYIIYYYDELIKYLEENYKKIKDDGSLRIKTLKSLLKKYIRTIKSIKTLDVNYYCQESDILVRTLLEMVIDIGYMELDPENNYERYNLFSDFKLYRYIEDYCKIAAKNIEDIEDINKIEKNYNLFKSKYKSKIYWSGKNKKDEATEVDKKIKKINKTMSLKNIYMIVYKYMCFNVHNNGEVNKHYVYLNLDAIENELCLYNINNLIIISDILTRCCLTDIFKRPSNLLDDFYNFMDSIK